VDGVLQPNGADALAGFTDAGDLKRDGRLGHSDVPRIVTPELRRSQDKEKANATRAANVISQASAAQSRRSFIRKR
jgi:hypothetical protein